MFQTDYMLGNVSVKGELSNVKYHSSGHIYFTLKDESGAVRAVMFAGNTGSLKFKMADGMKVVVKGKCDVYERDGTYQLYAREITEEGKGDLFLEFERLKKKLSEEGMFDEAYKRPIPEFVKKLGVVTAGTGAAVRDIINVSRRRNPGIQIVLYPATVQGDEAPASIIAGIRALEEYGVDVIIVGRGGGSIEDLWGFNDEMVAHAIFNCSVPVISGVGHETDFTIADFVADRRAATPSQAAEIAVCDVSAVLRRIDDYRRFLNKEMNRVLFNRKQACAHYATQLEHLSPAFRIAKQKKDLENYRVRLLNAINSEIKSTEARLSDRSARLMYLFDSRLKKSRHRLELSAGRLDALSPLKRLSGGYSYVSGTKGAVKRTNDVKLGESLTIHVTDGKIVSSVTDIIPLTEGEHERRK